MNIVAAAKAETVSALIRSITGSAPVIQDHGEYARIVFTPSQQVAIRAYLDKQINAALAPGAPGDLDIDINPVLFPLVVKRVAPFFIAALALGFLMGRKL